MRKFNELKNEKMKKYFLFGRSINNNDDDDDDKIDRYKINSSIIQDRLYFNDERARFGDIFRRRCSFWI